MLSDSGAVMKRKYEGGNSLESHPFFTLIHGLYHTDDVTKDGLGDMRGRISNVAQFFIQVLALVKGLKWKRCRRKGVGFLLYASSNLGHYPSQGDRKDDTQHHTIEASMYARLAFVYVEQHSAIIKGIALCNEQ
ncbi:hypothetical protein CDAR_263231 [Caerostris darwini]|uniref:Uncharacterized protein n=1 Tax=Caerostris darwini TaxID=1538125 RepID=A0AAV4RZP7_9ARAC|nr:hypothetical protein CDAR_263231 [Caerostris darwini]